MTESQHRWGIGHLGLEDDAPLLPGKCPVGGHDLFDHLEHRRERVKLSLRLAIRSHRIGIVPGREPYGHRVQPGAGHLRYVVAEKQAATGRVFSQG